MHMYVWIVRVCMRVYLCVHVCVYLPVWLYPYVSMCKCLYSVNVWTVLLLTYYYQYNSHKYKFVMEICKNLMMYLSDNCDCEKHRLLQIFYTQLSMQINVYIQVYSLYSELFSFKEECYFWRPFGSKSTTNLPVYRLIIQ